MGSHRQSAFTLVELLVVIAIIAVLVGILLPALSKARQQSLQVVCESQMRQWGMGLQMYVDQNKGQLPQKGPGGTNTGTDYFGPSGGVLGVNDPSLWFNAIPPLINQQSYYDLLVQDYNNGHAPPLTPAPHAGDGSLFTCPVQLPPGSQYLVTNGGTDLISGDYFTINGIDSYGVLKNATGNKAATTFKWACTYVFNSKLTTVMGVGDEGPGVKMSKLQPTSEVVVMTEMITNNGEYKDPKVQAYWNDSRASQLEASGENDHVNANGYSSNVAQPKADWNRFTTRHNHGGNLLFADGHVAWFAWTDVQIPLNGSTNWSANQPAKVTWCPLGPTD